MARYIDADKLIAEYDRVHVGPAGGARKLMVEAPTADVVPRAEAENYKSIAEHQQKLSMDRYFEIKQLKQELDKAKGEVERVYYNLQAVLEERAETKQEIAREIFEEIEYNFGDLRKVEYANAQLQIVFNLLDYLKKKYTEGKI